MLLLFLSSVNSVVKHSHSLNFLFIIIVSIIIVVVVMVIPASSHFWLTRSPLQLIRGFDS
jgi:hypothetical protein